mgnify:CR=1 FL=1
MSTPTIAPRPALGHIRRAAAHVYGLDADAIRAPGSHEPHLSARRVAACVARELGYSFPHIGRALGRDHFTILHAIRRFEELARREPARRDRCRRVLDLARQIAAGARLPALPSPAEPPARPSRRAVTGPHPRALPLARPGAGRHESVLICLGGHWLLVRRDAAPEGGAP